MSNILLENGSKLLLESTFGLLQEAGSIAPSLQPPSQGYFGSPFFKLINSSKGIINNGGTLLGVPVSTLHTKRIINSDYGIINTGKHNYVGNPVQPANTAKAVSAGGFGVIVADQYVIMTFTNQLAGLKSTLLINSGGNRRSSGNLNYPYVRTLLDAKTGGWYYTNGQPVNRQNQSDFIGTDNGKNRFTFLQSGGKPSTSSYSSKTD